MATSDAGAVLRGDLNGIVEEAAMAEKFYIGSRVFPPFGVNVRAGQYPKFTKGKGELLNDDATARTPGAAYGRVNREYENDTYTCTDRGLEEVVDDVYAKDISRYFNAEAAAARMTLRQVMIGHEVRVSAAIMATGTFTTTAAGVNYTVALRATTDFPQDILGAIDRLNALGETPNTIIMSGPMWTRVQMGTLFQNWIRGGRPADTTLNITPQSAADSFGVNGITQILIGRGVKNSAKKGQAFASSAIWPNTHIWVGNVQSGDPLEGGVGRTFVWNAEGGLFVTETYREENRRSDIVRVRQNTDEKVVNASAGQLITTNFA